MLLCGHVGNGIGGSTSQDILVGHLENREAGSIVKAASNFGVTNIHRPPAVVIMVSAASLEGSVDEEFQYPDSHFSAAVFNDPGVSNVV